MDTPDTTSTVFSDIPQVTATAKDTDKKFMSCQERWIKKQLRKERKMLRHIKELLVQQELKRQEAEVAAASKATKEAKQKGINNPFWDKVGNAVVKAIPAILTTVFGIIAKTLFQRKQVLT